MWLTQNRCSHSASLGPDSPQVCCVTWGRHVLSLSLRFLTCKMRTFLDWLLRSFLALIFYGFIYQGLGFHRSMQFQTLNTQNLKGQPKSHNFLLCLGVLTTYYLSFLFHERKYFPPKNIGRTYSDERMFLWTEVGSRESQYVVLVFLFLTRAAENFAQVVHWSADQCMGITVRCISSHIHLRA